MAVKKKQVGILYFTDGSVVHVKPLDGKKFELEEMQAAVGGLIERHSIRMKRRSSLWVNEEGIVHGLPNNKCLNRICRENPQDFSGFYIVGNALETFLVPVEDEVDRVTVEDEVDRVTVDVAIAHHAYLAKLTPTQPLY